MNSKIIATAAISAFAAISAHAFQGEANPLPPKPFQSMQTRAEVKAGAYNPLTVSETQVGQKATVGERNRADVKAGAKAAARYGVEAWGNVPSRQINAPTQSRS